MAIKAIFKHGCERAKSRARISPPLLLIILGLSLVLPNVALAAHESWHQQSHSYDVHLGVVPASVVRQDAALAQMHSKSKHGQTYKQISSTRHILVAVFRKSNMERVLDANITAEVVENDLIRLRTKKKPLERVHVAGGVTYCNFFDLHWNGLYQIDVWIREGGKSGEEHVTFHQRATGVPE